MHPRRERTLEILSDLIGFPTVSADSNLALIDYAADYLGRLGASVHTFRDPQRCGPGDGSGLVQRPV